MIKVINNVLDTDVNERYQRQLLDNRFPWFVVKDIAGRIEDENNPPDLLQYGLSHYFWAPEKNVHSNFTWRFLPALYEAAKREGIEVDTLLTMRSFFHPPSTQPGLLNGIHIDLPFPHMVCLYYVTDSDGDTVFFDDNDKEIFRQTPKKNTAVIFDGSIRHCSSTPSCHRVILNFDFTVAL